MKAQTTTMLIGMILLAALTTRAEEWNTNLPCFHGGSYDGWDRDAMTNAVGLGGALVSLSSGTNQTFAWTEANPALAMLTIEAEAPAVTITNGVTMHLSVPADWLCRFDTGATVSFSGDAAGKVGAASYADGGRTLSIPVTNTFVAADTLVLSGLRLADLRLASANTKQLELDFTGDSARDVYDQYGIEVSVTWAGGSYDGWDRYTTADYARLMGASGTLFTVR